MHRVKGLEFDRVIIASVNEGLVPLPKAIRGHADDRAREWAETEERALVYVAATRARKELLVLGHGVASTFVQADISERASARRLRKQRVAARRRLIPRRCRRPIQLSRAELTTGHRPMQPPVPQSGLPRRPPSRPMTDLSSIQQELEKPLSTSSTYARHPSGCSTVNPTMERASSVCFLTRLRPHAGGTRFLRVFRYERAPVRIPFH